ncbi:MAG: BamA/TamA family outer membrane protein [Chitinophagaceae bacterium]|nr:BamA/TamA family outer membrane protein [Chitinophagaceae bacterium]
MKAKDDSSKIDYTIFLTPSKRYTFSTNLESVFNQVQSSLSTAGNLVGLGVNFGLTDRNIAKQGIQMSQTIRVGVELGLPPLNTGLQATELTYSNTLSIPKIPSWFYKKKSRQWLNKKTFFTNTISVIDRNINKNGLFALTSITSTFGWQYQTKRNEIWRLSPLNIEYVKLYDISTRFKDQLDTTPFLRNSFNQGFVLGTFNVNYSKPQIIIKNEPNNTVIASYRITFGDSVAVFGRLKKAIPLFDKELFEYVKLDAEFKYKITKLKREWVFRAAAGAGYLYDNDTSSMPFFKQFAGGGPYSMRAWPLRSIGPGASPMEPRSGRNQFFSRTGDILFEVNAEYRYDILSIWPNSLILRGALFMDAGNVWNMRNNGNREMIQPYFS